MASSRPTTLSAESSLPDRLDQLERLIVSLRSELATSGGTKNQIPGKPDFPTLSSVPASADNADHDVPIDEASECGSMVISSVENRYVGREYWVAILDSIAELRDQVVADEIPHEDEDIEYANNQTHRALLLYGHRPSISRREILDSLPTKPIVDRYISRYFNNLDLVSCV